VVIVGVPLLSETEIQQNKDWNIIICHKIFSPFLSETEIQQNKDWNKPDYYVCVSVVAVSETEIQQNKDWNWG